MLAAPQQLQGTMALAPAGRPALTLVASACGADDGDAPVPISPSMTPTQPDAHPRKFTIQGLTVDGRSFRPSDWAERLASAMSCFRPDGAAGGIGAFIGYSPYCVPTVIDGVKCVIVNEALKGIEPMAWDFVMNFARDNDLRLSEGGAESKKPA
jgi:Protein of unknown function (DUF3579)